jgi:hypothetical protein
VSRGRGKRSGLALAHFRGDITIKRATQKSQEKVRRGDRPRQRLGDFCRGVFATSEEGWRRGRDGVKVHRIEKSVINRREWGVTEVEKEQKKRSQRWKSIRGEAEETTETGGRDTKAAQNGREGGGGKSRGLPRTGTGRTRPASTPRTHRTAACCIEGGSTISNIHSSAENVIPRARRMYLRSSRASFNVGGSAE